MCADATAPLVTTEAGPLPCAEATTAVRWAERLAGRSMEQAAADRLLQALAEAATDDLARVRADLTATRRALDGLNRAQGLAAAEARSRAVWEVGAGQGPLPRARYPDVAAVADKAIAVWQRDDAMKLVLTEMDVEGWLRYASLAREVQGAPPMRVSIADKVAAYRIVQDRWRAGDRSERIALTAFGAFWPGLRNAWRAASYETQQRFAQAAPLPGPMTATSLGYLEVLTEGRVAAHAAALHGALGPLPLSAP